MKKSILLSALLLSLAINQHASAQFWEDEEPKPEAMLRKGDIMVTGFGSYPNFGRFSARVVLQSANIASSSTGGFAPLGIQGEYMLTNNFGISLDLIANQWSARWSETSFDGQIYESSVSVFRFRGLLGLNYHIDDLENDKLNVYGGFALGYNYRQIGIRLNEFSSISNFWESNIVFPLAFRLRAGLRYFLNDNIGLNVELGAGGSIMSFGVTLRIPETPKVSDQKNKM